jgi:hypothetical protein
VLVVARATDEFVHRLGFSTCPVTCRRERGASHRGPWSALRFFGDSCGSAEVSRRDADDALEVMRELALIREATPVGISARLPVGCKGCCAL